MSIGGFLAYEAAKQLIEAGQEVASVLTLDFPCRVMLPPMPPPLIDYLDLVFFGADTMSPREKDQLSTMHRFKMSRNWLRTSLCPFPLLPMHRRLSLFGHKTGLGSGEGHRA